jgi:hypothetical protein
VQRKAYCCAGSYCTCEGVEINGAFRCEICSFACHHSCCRKVVPPLTERMGNLVCHHCVADRSLKHLTAKEVSRHIKPVSKWLPLELVSDEHFETLKNQYDGVYSSVEDDDSMENDDTVKDDDTVETADWMYITDKEEKAIAVVLAGIRKKRTPIQEKNALAAFEEYPGLKNIFAAWRKSKDKMKKRHAESIQSFIAQYGLALECKKAHSQDSLQTAMEMCPEKMKVYERLLAEGFAHINGNRIQGESVCCSKEECTQFAKTTELQVICSWCTFAAHQDCVKEIKSTGKVLRICLACEREYSSVRNALKNLELLRKSRSPSKLYLMPSDDFDNRLAAHYREDNCDYKDNSDIQDSLGTYNDSWYCK